ncbi:uncharacterized protein BYT42DRAFT_546924 [Radiomyces spectabilis]|uniref:uncharacterized protein n=1 Tax=Radiomyces spectabilis TaxID=64574 RepID=UPI00222028AC|nr:uncharacterized protein BYT42DRAFT_546924 [Radiomyces spectabilis]KAI8376223.1 hypothetical protein BYT42DRAFT_546924 [Radiomyces spectabilis]
MSPKSYDYQCSNYYRSIGSASFKYAETARAKHKKKCVFEMAKQIDETLNFISHPASYVSGADEMGCVNDYAPPQSGSEVPAENEDDSLDNMEWNTNDELVDQRCFILWLMKLPPQHGTGWKSLQLCIKLHQRAFRRKIPHRFMEELIEDINEYVPVVFPPLPSNYKAKAALLERYPVKSPEYDMRSNGCMMFTNARNDLDEAYICGTPRFKIKNPLNPEVSVVGLSTVPSCPLHYKMRKTK